MCLSVPILTQLLLPFVMSAEKATRLDEQSSETGHAFRQGQPWLQVVLPFVAQQQGQDGPHQ